MVDGAMWLCHYHIHPIMETLIIWIYIYIHIHIYIYTYLYIYMYGWWFQPTPLKNDGVRQLG